MGLYGEEQSGDGLCSYALLTSSLGRLERYTAILLGSLNKHLMLQTDKDIPDSLKRSWSIICLDG